MTTAAPRLSIVVNCFNPGSDARIRAMTEFAVRCYAKYTAPTHELILVDGSGLRDASLEAACEEFGYRYLNPSRRLSFAEGYNAGLREARADWVVIAANDIFVVAGWAESLIAGAERTGAWMASPYLSCSDYPAQRFDYVIGRKRDFAPSFLTFNLNLISRHCLETVGLIDEQFGGCFNDVDYTLRIREQGGEVAVTHCGEIAHLGRGTLNHAAVLALLQRDFALFEAKWPGQWDRERHRITETRTLLKFWFALEALVPRWWVHDYREVIYRLEPRFSRCRPPRAQTPREVPALDPAPPIDGLRVRR